MAAPSKYEILKAVLDTDEPPQLGPKRRNGALPAVEVNDQVNSLLSQAGLTGDGAALTRSLALLWHDHLEASHELSQSISSADGSYVHGIMHRREPDFGNAAYWFRRVGEHPIYRELADAVAGLRANSTFTERLTNGDQWNALAMVDACEAVDVGSADDNDDAFLREVQSIEFHLLLKRFSAM